MKIFHCQNCIQFFSEQEAGDLRKVTRDDKGNPVVSDPEPCCPHCGSTDFKDSKIKVMT